MRQRAEDQAPALARAYAECLRLARSHEENFPVASRLLPASMRPHVAALYAFARIADDMADEGAAGPEERRARLDEWRRRLHAAAGDRDGSATPAAADLVIAAAAHSIRTLDLPLALFDDLVSAFRQDTMVVRFASWADLLDYCRRSANPVGRLILRMADCRGEPIEASSDALCTALQLTNFWQDLGRDWRAGRLYVPAEVSAACGAEERALCGGAELDEPWARAVERCVSVTEDHFARGRLVCDAVSGRLGLELRLTWLGGRRILERVRRGRRRLLQRRPALGAADVAVIAWRALAWRKARAAHRVI